MKILILGGDGFIGSHLLQAHIKRGDECFVIDINSIRTNSTDDQYVKYIHDLSDNPYFFKCLLKEIKPDLVYNCVAVATPAYYVKHPIETYDLDFNVNYNNICLPLIEYGCPFIQFSTCEVYGKRWECVYTEDSDCILGATTVPRWIYATSKIMLEQLLISHKANCVIIRPQNFFGWDMDWLPGMESNTDKKWIPRLPAMCLNSIIYKSPFNVVLPGTQKRCYTHIDDGVSGILSIVDNFEKCSNYKDGPVFNIGNPYNELTVDDIAKRFGVAFNRVYKEVSELKILEKYKGDTIITPDIRYVASEELYGKGYEDCERRLFSTDRIYETTGWVPETPITPSINEVVKSAIINYNTILYED